MQGIEVVPQQYDYLDQNIIIYARDEMKKGSNIRPLFQAISNQKNNGFAFPYSQAHILDFFSKDLEAKGPYASMDLSILSNISNNNCLGTAHEGNRLLLLMRTCHPREALKLFRPDDFAVRVPHFVEFCVNMKQVNTEHPFYDMLVKNGGCINSLIIQDYLSSLEDDVDNLKSFNKILRNRHDVLGNIPQKMIDFLDFSTREQCFVRENFADILRLAFELKGEQYHYSNAYHFPFAYWVLNQCTGFRDKLSKKNNIKNINADGLHFLYAHKARYLISSDDKFLKKCRFLIEFFGLTVKAISKDDFLAM